MNRKSILKIVAGIVLGTGNVLPCEAQEVAGVEISPESTLPITGVTVTTDGIYNFKNFEVEAAEAGAYYTEFWLLPSRYANNGYTSFIVYVNGNRIGTINPTVGNWQAARVNEHETFDLTEGKNVITIATLSPEFPEIETLKVALNDADATFSSEAYEEYLNDAAQGVTYDIPEEEGMTVFAANAEGVGPEHFSNVPLNYTFYKNFKFTKNEEIYIATTSSAPHKIDIVFFGSDPKIVPPGNLNRSTSIPTPDTPGSNKHPLVYTPATSEEMQGLSLVFPSEKALNTNVQMATARFTVQKSGEYIVRVRHLEDGASALADVNVNGEYLYEGMPITLSYRDCVIPADGNYYATFTCSNNFRTDDPYLFIQGGGCDKIVGFNDDAPTAKSNQYNLSSKDSFISQKYFMKTRGITVSNYSSSNPKSRCNIFARISEGSSQSVAKSKAKDSNEATESERLMADESVHINLPADINRNIVINASEKIQKVAVYGPAGNCLGSVNCNESYVNMRLSSLNINQPGVYIVSVETLNGEVI